MSSTTYSMITMIVIHNHDKSFSSVMKS